MFADQHGLPASYLYTHTKQAFPSPVLNACQHFRKRNHLSLSSSLTPHLQTAFLGRQLSFFPRLPVSPLPYPIALRPAHTYTPPFFPPLYALPRPPSRLAYKSAPACSCKQWLHSFSNMLATCLPLANSNALPVCASTLTTYSNQPPPCKPIIQPHTNPRSPTLPIPTNNQPNST
jgi:hypothetical protein